MSAGKIEEKEEGSGNVLKSDSFSYLISPARRKEQVVSPGELVRRGVDC